MHRCIKHIQRVNKLYLPKRRQLRLKINNGIMENLSENAIKSLLLSQIYTKYYQSSIIHSEHVLLGISSFIHLKDDATEDIVKPIYSNMPNFTIRNIQFGVEEMFNNEINKEMLRDSILESVQTDIELVFSDELKEILYISEKERNKYGLQFITPEGILLSMLNQDNSCRAQDVLKYINVDISLLRDTLYKQVRDIKEMTGTYTQVADVSKICIDLCKQAKENKIDPVFGRDKEITHLVQILGRKTKANPIIVGEPGVGKTAIVEGLAYKIVHDKKSIPSDLWDKTIWQLDIASLMGGTSERGELEKRLTTLLDTLKKNKGNIILMIDEIHTLVSRGGGGTKTTSSDDAAPITNILKPALARGEISCIGATTYKEYSMYFQKDTAFDRRFQPIYIDQPDTFDAIQILHGLKSAYEKYHGCKYDDSAIEAAVILSKRFIPERNLPDKAIDLIDEAGSRVKMLKSINTTITDTEIKDVITSWTGIPITEKEISSYKNLQDVEYTLKKKIIGQADAIDSIMNVLKRSTVDFRNPNRPMASLLFVGSSGVGKTELVEQLHQAIYSERTPLIRFDMSEYMETFSINTLIGAPPGYVGFENAGKLTEAVRRNPYSVVLFDEIEKAHKNICNILLQILEDGQIKDSKGKTVSFKNTIIILTSNLGTSNVKIKPEMQEIYSMNAIKEFFKPELLNRFDEIVYFKDLDKISIKRIINKNIKESITKINKKGYQVMLSKESVDKIHKEAEESNAREIKNIIRRYIEDIAAEQILESSNNKTIKI